MPPSVPVMNERGVMLPTGTDVVIVALAGRIGACVRSVHGSAANSAGGLAAAHRGVARSGAGTKRRGHQRRGRRDHDDDPGWAARVRVRRRSLAGPGQRDAPAGREHEDGAAAVERRTHLADRRGGRREAGEPGRVLQGAHRRPGLGAGRHGVAVVGLMSREHSGIVSAAPGLPKLPEIADYLLDNGGCFGDAALDIAGVAERMAPTSTIVGAALIHAVWAEAGERLAARGYVPEVWGSANRGPV